MTMESLLPLGAPFAQTHETLPHGHASPSSRRIGDHHHHHHHHHHHTVDSLLSGLQRCREAKSGEELRGLHLQICGMGLDTHESIGNVLIPVFVDCGHVNDAHQALNRLDRGQEFSWTCVVQGFIQRQEFQRAFTLYSRMQEDLVSPSKYTFIALLKACSSLKSLGKGRELHIDIVKAECENDVYVGSSLVTMYAKCGLLADALKVFEDLPDPNVVSWTAIISGYADNGFGEEAVDCFQKMLSQGFRPNVITYFSTLKACAIAEDLMSGAALHAEIIEEGFEADFSVGSTLVDMYAKCGALLEAEGVFDELMTKDVVPWTALIAGYVNHGREEEGLSCFERMQAEGVSPDAITLLFMLKACGSIGDMNRGQEIHARVIKGGYEHDPCLSNAMVDMYARNGFLVDAQQIFNNLPQQDAISWSVLLGGYTENELNDEALECAERMRLEGVPLDAVMFLYFLKACGNSMDVEKGRLMHGEVIREGFEVDIFVGSAVLDMYAKCGLLAEAQAVFDESPSRDTLLWNALLGGYADRGFGENVLQGVERMESEGVYQDAFTSVCCLKAVSSMKLIQRGQEAHVDATKKGFEDDRFVINALVYMYAKCRSFGEAMWVLEASYPAERASWNALMAGFSEEGLGDEVLECFERMERQGISPDVVTFLCCLKACGMVEGADLGGELHAEIIMKNFEGDAFLSSALLDMYAKLGLLSEARDIFDKLSLQSSSSWTSLISGYAERGLCEEAADCFDRMLSEGGRVSVDVLPWNALILGYAEREGDGEPFEIFSAMQEQALLPDKVSFLNLLKACSSKSSVKRGDRVHAQMCLARSEADPFQLTALLDMYSKCGCMADARRIFDSIPDKDLIAWNALIMGYARQGEIEHALDSFETMLDRNVKPNEATFVNVLSVCNHAGLVQKGQLYFEAMSRDHGLTPSLQHYSCMLDLLSRAGRLEEALELMNSMPLRPDDVLLNILLSACSKWGNVQVGKQVFERLVALTGLQSASFAIMSNIYADGSEGD